MYVVPIILLALVLLLALVWAPIFAAVIFLIGFAIFLAYVGLRPRADQRRPPGEANFAAQASNPPREPERAGMWGQKDAEDS